MDRYNVLSYLGVGASGEALLVVEKSTGTEFVMKRIPTIGMNKEEKSRVSKEANTLQMLNHPNIVRFKESFFDGGGKSSNNNKNKIVVASATINMEEEHFCIVMERCVCSLEDLVNRCHEIPENKGGFPQSLLIEWMTELLAALSFLQQKGIIHRDIKASNIFVTKKNHLKIGDFGVAKHVSASSSKNNNKDNNNNNDADATPSSTQSSTNSVAFSAFYMTPELCDGATSTFDHKGDVWSLGILFFELCKLHPPFQGGNILAIVNEITTKSVPQLPPNFDGRFNKIIRWMLKKDPAQRPTAQDVLNKYVFLPPSHPSHPQHDPDKGRTIQEKHGPPLVLNAGGESISSNNSNKKKTEDGASNTNTDQQQQAERVGAKKTGTGSNASSSSSPSGRIDGNKVQQQQQNQNQNQNHLFARPPASIVDDDEEESDEPQNNKPEDSSSSTTPLSSSFSNDNNNGFRKLSAPPQAFLDEDVTTEASGASESNNSSVNNNLSNSSKSNKDKSTSNSAATTTVNNNNATNRVPLQVVDGNNNNSSDSSSNNNSNNNNNPAAHLTTVKSSSIGCNSSNESTTATSKLPPLSKSVLELLEAKRDSLTSSEIDEAVCTILEFRTKMKL